MALQNKGFGNLSGLGFVQVLKTQVLSTFAPKMASRPAF